jgi:hypothetical protein
MLSILPQFHVGQHLRTSAGRRNRGHEKSTHNFAQRMGKLANGWLGNAVLVVCLLVFGAVCVREIFLILL